MRVYSKHVQCEADKIHTVISGAWRTAHGNPARLDPEAAGPGPACPLPVPSLLRGARRRQESSSVPISPSPPPPPPTLLGGALCGLGGQHRLELSFCALNDGCGLGGSGRDLRWRPSSRSGICGRSLPSLSLSSPTCKAMTTTPVRLGCRENMASALLALGPWPLGYRPVLLLSFQEEALESPLGRGPLAARSWGGSFSDYGPWGGYPRSLGVAPQSALRPASDRPGSQNNCFTRF